MMLLPLPLLLWLWLLRWRATSRFRVPQRLCPVRVRILELGKRVLLPVIVHPPLLLHNKRSRKGSGKAVERRGKGGGKAAEMRWKGTC